MYHSIYKIVLYSHILIGSLSLISFWLPLIVKKGSKRHKQTGFVFTYGMLAVSISGVIVTLMVLIDPLAIRDPNVELALSEAITVANQSRIFAWFLLMLSILVFCSTRHALLVLHAKADRTILKHWTHITPVALLGVLGAYVLHIGINSYMVLLQVFSVFCMVTSIRLFHYIYKKEIKQREWIIQHLSNILGSGIGAYTAFFAFGGRELLSSVASNQYLIFFWVSPGVIGGLISYYYSKKYSKTYKVA